MLDQRADRLRAALAADARPPRSHFLCAQGRDSRWSPSRRRSWCRAPPRRVLPHGVRRPRDCCPVGCPLARLLPRRQERVCWRLDRDPARVHQQVRARATALLHEQSHIITSTHTSRATARQHTHTHTHTHTATTKYFKKAAHAHITTNHVTCHYLVFQLRCALARSTTKPHHAQSRRYFKYIKDKKWQLKQWSGPAQFENEDDGSLMMLPTDMALLTDTSFRK
jgi:hypothetical protein